MSVNEDAKSLLSNLRNRRGRWVVTGSNPMFGPAMFEASAFDEMVELYIAARESADTTALRNELDALKEKHKKLSEESHDLRIKAKSADNMRDAYNLQRERWMALSTHLLREGDILCLEKYKRKERRKVISYDFKTKSYTFVIWDERRKTWCTTVHSNTIGLMLDNAGIIVQVTRPGDMEQGEKSEKRK